MNHQPLDPHETETSVRDIGLRHTVLADQYWNRAKSKALAEAKGLTFSDRHPSMPCVSSLRLKRFLFL